MSASEGAPAITPLRLFVSALVAIGVLVAVWKYIDNRVQPPPPPTRATTAPG